MGTMTFLLPSGLPGNMARELERVCVAGGPDNMPWPTQVRITGNQLQLRRDVNESGCVVVPWDIAGAGLVMGSTATLMERDTPYRLETELARGKVNQVRCQAWEWRAGGLQINADLEARIRHASSSFAEALVQGASDEGGQQATAALRDSYQAANHLVRAYTEQVFHLRRQRQPKLETQLACRLPMARLSDQTAGFLAKAFNTVSIPFTWNAIEPTEGNHRWDIVDELLDWAEANELHVIGGPLLDFASSQLPDWLWLWERDLGSLAKFMENFVATVVHRYRKRIRTWQMTVGSNCANVLSLGEDELLWLTVRLVEIARQIDPELKPIIGIAQPWGEYMAQEDRTHSPFVFADTLIRSGLNLAAVDLELVMGVTPRGSYCRDLLEISRLLDLYAILGVPLRVTAGFPSGRGADAKADPELRVGSGLWVSDYGPSTQALWAAEVVALAACKPYVQGASWIQATDSEPHLFPHCGLFDSMGQPKPALEQLRMIRDKYLG